MKTKHAQQQHQSVFFGTSNVCVCVMGGNDCMIDAPFMTSKVCVCVCVTVCVVVDDDECIDCVD